MKSFLIFAFLFINFKNGLACMAVRGGGGGDITTIAPCALAADNAGIFLATGANLVDNVYGMVPATGTCTTCANGADTYYPPAATAVPHATDPQEAAGSLTVTSCPNMCVCDAAGICYTRNTDDTVVTLWPYCTGGTCAMYAYLTGALDTDGLVPVGGTTPTFTAGAQTDPVTFDALPVTDASYPKIASAGCNGCPITTC